MDREHALGAVRVPGDVPVAAVTDEGLGNTSWVVALDGEGVVVATPGHTPEHVAYLLREDGEARAVFTGGSLLVGAVARTDLIDPDDTEALTRALYRSINHRLLELPDDVLVLPTHGAGSFCSAAGGGNRWTTIGGYPPYFTRMRALNQRGPTVYGTFPTLPALTAADIHDLRARGAIVVDVRPVADYAAGHVPGSLANTLRPQFASWLGWLVEDPETPLVFVTDAHTDRRELVRQCPGAGHVELGALPAHATSTANGPVVVMCGHGERAATAASVLEAAGRDGAAILDGGPGDWAAATGEQLEVRS